MFGNLELVGSETIFTSDDLLSIELVLKPHKSNIASVYRVTFSLACEGTFTIKNAHSAIKFYESEHISIDQETTTNHRFSTQLVFPSSSMSKLPGSLAFDGCSDGIRWFAKADVTDIHGDVMRTFTKTVFFVPSAEPPLLAPVISIDDYEHTEPVACSTITMVTSYSSAGLPEVPLAAGIGLTVMCGDIDYSLGMCIRRVRILLREHNEIRLNGDRKLLPSRRWLLGDHIFYNSVPLYDNSKLDLDNLTSQVRVDHARLTPSFSLENIVHKFELNVQLTVEWHDGDDFKRLNAYSPVCLLPRVLGADFISPQNRCLVDYFDSCEITDSTDMDSDDTLFSDFEDNPSEISGSKSEKDNVVVSSDDLMRFYL